MDSNNILLTSQYNMIDNLEIYKFLFLLAVYIISTGCGSFANVLYIKVVKNKSMAFGTAIKLIFLSTTSSTTCLLLFSKQIFEYCERFETVAGLSLLSGIVGLKILDYIESMPIKETISKLLRIFISDK